MSNYQYRKIGLGLCLAAICVAGIAAQIVPSQAQSLPIATTPPATGGLMTPQQFLQNPQALVNAPGGIGANVLNLLNGGGNPASAISPQQLAQFLQSAGMQIPVGTPQNPGAAQILSMIQQGITQGGMTPEAATDLITDMAINAATPAIQQALSAIGLDQTQVAALMNSLTPPPTGGGGGGGGGGGSGQDRDNGNYELDNRIGVTHGDHDPGCATCIPHRTLIPQDHNEIRQFTKDEFIKHRNWIVNTYWKEHILPALMLMAEQLTAVGIAQVEMIGAMLDAKHQLETQRLFQQLTAQAHKDYHPSEGMCTFGTTVRSLAASERKSDLIQVGLAGRMMQRQMLSGDVVSFEGESSDTISRINRFRTTYCDRMDNANGLDVFCRDAESAPERRNIDVDFTRNIESRLTLDIDMTAANPNTEDQQDLFALAANLYSNNVAPKIIPEQLANDQEQVRQDGAERYLDLRSVYAKRSVAQNSFAALTAMRASGDEGSAPYTKALLRELGISSQDEIEKILGERPSYFAQMEVLTKKIYQNPSFYTELYDKPVNVERKGAAIEAISLMQDRDLYNSLLRSEAVLSVLLETMLMKEQSKVVNAIPETD